MLWERIAVPFPGNWAVCLASNWDTEQLSYSFYPQFSHLQNKGKWYLPYNMVMSGGTGIFSISLWLKRKKRREEKRILTFSAKVKIFLWSTPPNWASTFKYSSSKACGEKTHEHQLLLYFFYMHLGNQKLLISHVKGTHCITKPMKNVK